jgi:signal transduction histidine kinase
MLFQTLRVRILLVVCGVVFLTALSISFFAQRGIEQTISSSAEQHARDLMNTVLLNVETEYESLVFHKTRTLARRKSELKNIINLAFAHIDEYHRKHLAGLLSLQAAQQEAINAIRLLRYDEGVGYIWINDLGKPIPRMIMHPTLPELEGKILDDPVFNSAQGVAKNLFVAAIEEVQVEGEGYIDYLWPKPTTGGLTEQQPKLSYVSLFKEWGWILGTGVYIDDIEEETQKRLDAIVDELANTFARVRVADTGYMAVFDGSRQMLIHPSIAGTSFSGYINPDSGNELADDLMTAAEQPDKAFDYTWDRPESRNEFRFAKRAYVSYFEPLDWYIVSTMYVDEIEQPIKILRSRTMQLSFFLLIAGFILATVLSRSLTRPLGKLALAAEEIEQKGIADAGIPVSGTLETKELGQVLNKMVLAIRQVKDDLRDKNRELETFAYTVSHDLRIPLTPIIGYAQLLQDLYREKLDEQALEFIGEIETQGGKMLEMIENLLILTKGGDLDCPAEPVEVEGLIRKTLVGLEKAISAAGVNIHISPLPTIHVPESFLSQIFDNLVGNAVRYAGKKNTDIEIGGERRGEKVCFFVRDHGRGIPAEERERIFETFFRGAASKEISGSGVGLSTVRKIARTYGGRAWVEETPGGGSTFRVEMIDTLPSEESG